MARTITTRLAIKGESEYKAKIKNINAELSLHKSELEKVQAEYKNSVNSMAALTAKQSALKGQMEALNQKHDEQAAMLEKAQKAQKEYSNQVEELRKRLDEVKNSSADTAEEEKRLNEEIAAAEEGLQKATNSATYYQRQLNITERDQANLSSELEQTERYLDEARASADECAKSIDEYGKEVKEAGEESEDFGDKSTGAIDALASVLAAAGVAKTIKEIADTLLECAEAAEGFESSIAKVATIADTSSVSMEEIKAQIISLSSETGKSASSIAEATYSAISAGVDTASAVETVAQATKLAAGGFTETETAIDVLTTALNAYGMSVSETEKVSDVLITTQNKGKTTVDELAQSVGGVIPLAAAYGVEIENLGAAYAVLTAQGTPTAESGTKIKAMLSELGDSGSTAAGILKEQTGKSFADLMTGGASLGDVLAILGDSVGGSATAFNELWSSTEAGVGALAIFNSGAEGFNDVLRDMQESAGATEAAYKTMADTTEIAHQRMTNAAENLKIAVGDQLNPALEKLYTTGADAFTWAADFVEESPWIVNAIIGVTAGFGTMAAAVAIYEHKAELAAAKTAILNAVMNANPAVFVAAGIVGLVAAVGSYIASIDSAGEETKAFIESLEDSKTAYEELSETMAAEQETTAATAASLQELLAVEEKSALQKDLIAQKVDELNEAIPELGLAYDKERDSLEGLTEAELASALERAAAREEYEAQIARLNELDTERAAIEARLTEARLALNEAEETGVGNTRELNNNISELTAALDENAAEYAEIQAASAEYAEQQAATAQKTQEATQTVDGLISELNELEEEYNKSYNAAMESIDGQLGLFNELDGSAKTSIDNLIGTLQGQVSYMETYAANIQKAMELGVDEGLIRKLSDGSEESAQILAAIVEGGEEDIAALNEQLAKVEEGKEAFSETVAEMETDFSDKMKDIEDRVKEMADELDASAEAQAAGMATIDGYIDGAESMRSSLVSTYRSLANAANNAYKSTLDIHSPSRVFKESGRNTIRGAIEGAEEEGPNLERTYSTLAESAIRAYEKSRPSGTEAGLLAAQREQTAAIVAAVQSRGGGPGGIAIYVDKLEVRDDQDVGRVARELYYLAERESRSRGGGSL